MKVTLTGYENRDNNRSADLVVAPQDGPGIHTYCGRSEPEDATLYRDLKFFLDIPTWLKMAHEAGQRGEGLDVHIDLEWDT